jgi:MSHA biogenesis protein MshP
MKPHPTLQQGFAAIAAIFLVLLLAALGAFIVSFSNTQQLTSAQDIQGSRAYWAARAGLEWALASTIGTTCPAGGPPLIPGFTIVPSCNVLSFTEAGITKYIFQFTYIARTGTPGSIGYIERSVSASMEK